MTSAVLTSALVTPFCILASASFPTPVRMSQPSTSFASPAAMRVAWSCSGVSAIRTCETTAPFFCARPVMSSTLQPLPSRCAAMPSSAPIVTTPVPPMPVTRMPYGSALDGMGRLRQMRQVDGLGLLRLAQLAAFDGDEARAEAR